ncbi:MAG: energy-coupling factor ABC transporter ATP-binding protein [Desulfurispora sp.]|uniref:energy-coupling factor ABC transporter ATP-binding protein n=1 Tax=Desulfurispora sp. TaxID=3014275 RepID=UPI004049CCF3
MIWLEKVCFQYPDGPPVLQDITLHIGSGEFVALLGANGSGKTTLLKLLNGLLRPVSGRVVIDGLDTAQSRTSQLARRVGFLFQNPDHQIFCSTVYEEIAFGLKNTGHPTPAIPALVREAARQVGLEHLLSASPCTLSKSQRQQVALASVLALGTPILVLDEPTTGQAHRTGRAILELIRQMHRAGRTIIMVTHDLELALMYAQRSIVLQNGRVTADGPTRAIMSQREVLLAAGLEQPQICQLASLLQKDFPAWSALHRAATPSEMLGAILHIRGGERSGRSA